MNKNKLLAIGFRIGIASLVACSPQAGEEQPPSRPNIIFILADDLGWADVGYNSGGKFTTPHIDRMKKQGFYFSQAYANAPVCAPSRACLLTGLYPPRHRIYNVNKSHAGPAYSWPLLTAPRNEDLDTAFVTMAEALKAADYHTGFIGKWHLREDKPEGTPQNQGFDYVFGGDPDGKPASHFPTYGPPSLPDIQSEKYLADLLTDSAISYIEANAQTNERPFFLFLSHYAVHDPIEAKAADIRLFEDTFLETDSIHFNPTYAAMVKNLDDNIGRMLQTVEQNGLSENTIFVFFSDNGGSLGYTSNQPLRSGKGTLYEGGIRVPLIFYSQGDWVKSGESDLPVHSLDFFPTLLSFATADAQTNLDGKDLSETIRTENENDSLDDRSIYWFYPAQKNFRLRHKPQSRFERTTFPGAVIRKGNFKLIYYFDVFPDELYDMANDIGEQHNLTKSKPELHQNLLQDLKSWMKETEAYIPTKNPEFDSLKSKELGLWR